MTKDEEAYMEAIDALESVRERILKPEIGMTYTELCNLEDRAKALEEIIADLEESMWEDHLGQEKDSKILCPSCCSENVIHTACGDYVYTCSCDDAEEEFYCGWCNQSFYAETQFPVDQELQQLSLSDMLGSAQQQPRPVKDCGNSGKHLHQVVTLPDETVVRCTASRNGSQIKETPDFGLYADSSWVSLCQWRNEIINWPDMQLPKNLNLAIDQIEDAYRRAEDGQHVDIGCIGAHGRTGTILAIMVLLATEGAMTGKEAIQWVWDKYCKHAIETKRQEWYVEYAAGYLFGYEVPEEPKPAPTNTSCGATEHLAMKMAGLDKCPKPECKWWEKDMVELETKQTISSVPLGSLMQNSSYEQYLKEYSGNTW